MIDQTYNIPLFEEDFEEAARILTERVRGETNIILDIQPDGTVFEIINNGFQYQRISRFNLERNDICPCNKSGGLTKYKKCHGRN